MKNWHVQELRETDLDALCQIEDECFSPPWSSALLAGYLAHERYRGIGLFVVDAATGTQCLVGFALFSLVLDEAELLQIGVTRADRGRGGGKVLLEAAHERLKAERISRIMLEVRRSNSAAIGLYRRCGYQEDGCRKGYYTHPDGREDALLMSCERF